MKCDTCKKANICKFLEMAKRDYDILVQDSKDLEATKKEHSSDEPAFLIEVVCRYYEDKNVGEVCFARDSSNTVPNFNSIVRAISGDTFSTTNTTTYDSYVV